MRPIDSAYDRTCAADEAEAREWLNPETAEAGTRVDYPGVLGDAGYHAVIARLRGRGLYLHDDGSGYVVRRRG